jgi:hypothetical protein
LTLADVRWAVVPALLVLAAGIVIPLLIAYWLRVRYGPYAITQWTPNPAPLEFWCLKVPGCGLLVLWAIALVMSLRRCRTAAGRQLSIAAGLVALVFVGISFIAIMDGPFP